MNKALLISLLTNGRDGLANTAQAVPDDKLDWKPLDNGRTVLDLLGEAAQTPALLLRLIKPEGGAQSMREMFGRMREERQGWTREECLQKLSDNSAALLAALEEMSEEELAQPLAVSMGPGRDMTQPVAGWGMMCYRSFVSRFAQINYIQTLYGDFDAH